ncbi:MAG: pyridoxal phosphate-dependent decarboxylase family protein [Alphaproteobacteria bacterium]
MNRDKPPAPGLDRATFEALGARMIGLAADHLDGIPDRPVNRPLPPELRRRLLNLELPEDGQDPRAVIDFIGAEVLPWPMGNGHPRFYAWVNSPPAPIAVLADALAMTMDPSANGAEHAGRFLLKAVTRWLAELIGYPTDGTIGLLVGGGSMANLTALGVARFAAARAAGWNVREQGLQGGREPLVVYASDEAHSCIRKSIELLGIGTDNLRPIPTGADGRLPVAELARAIAADRAAGRRPACVVASAGTVNTGAIDPLGALADLCRAEGLWLHVDGAYGAFGRVDPAVAPLYAGLERADSVALDPHKWLSVPIGCGAVLVRDGETQRAAFTLVPPYLDSAKVPDPDNPRWTMEYGFTLTSQLRAVKLYAALAHMGRAGVRRMVAGHNALARDLATRIAARDDMEVLAPVTLSVVCFRYRPAGTTDEAALDALNARLVEALNGEGQVHIQSTRIKGRLALRACIMHYANDADDMAHLVARVAHWGARLA